MEEAVYIFIFLIFLFFFFSNPHKGETSLKESISFFKPTLQLLLCSSTPRPNFPPG